MKLHKQATIAAIVLAISGSAVFGADRLFGNDKDQRGQFSERDYRFVKEAARGGMSEVELGQLAKTKGTTQAVRDFGDRMVKDHQKANDELKDIASKKGAQIPADLTRTEKSTMDKLQKANGANFDKEYADLMLKDHKTDVKEFKDAADDVKDPELKAFAQKTIPTLEEHLRMAQNMQRSLTGVSPTGRKTLNKQHRPVTNRPHKQSPRPRSQRARPRFVSDPLPLGVAHPPALPTLFPFFSLSSFDERAGERRTFTLNKGST